MKVTNFALLKAKLPELETLGSFAEQYLLAGINQRNLNNVLVMIPPIKLQLKFSDVVAYSEKIKMRMKKSSVEIDKNFNSLVQRAFRGDL